MQDTNVDYRILSYVSSEIEEHGTPCLVTLRLHGQIHGFLLSDWQSAVTNIDELSAEWLDEILNVFRFQSDGRKDQAEAFFVNLEALSVGPLRTTSAGHFLANELNLEDFRQDQPLTECSEDRLAALINNILTVSSRA